MSASEQKSLSHILVIKHGALGDMILATGPMAAIRQQHPQAHIILLTTPPYANLMRQSPYFNEVWVDVRPKAWMLRRLIALAAQLNSRPFEWVYDLQTSQRSSRYRKLMACKPKWSGIARGASHRHDTPERTTLHTIERQKEQLAIAGIAHVPAPDIGWMHEPVDTMKPSAPYVLIVPGGSAHRPQKRWPVAQYVELCAWLASRHHVPVLIGTQAEAELLNAIAHAVPQALNLCNRTRFAQIAELARHAVCAVGNDTGPMHIIAATGCPSSVLFSYASNPALCAPRGDHVCILREEDLATLSVEAVKSTLALAVAA